MSRKINAWVEIAEVTVDDPGPRDVVVAVSACGVCHTDLAYVEGGISDEYPYLLGHEAAGIVDVGCHSGAYRTRRVDVGGSGGPASGGMDRARSLIGRGNVGHCAREVYRARARFPCAIGAVGQGGDQLVAVAGLAMRRLGGAGRAVAPGDS